MEAERPLRSAIITGGGSGIGRALAHELAGADLTVLIAGRRQAELRQTAGNCSGNIVTVAGDVTYAEDRRRIAQAAQDLPGPCALFHGAGYFQTGLLADLNTSDWNRSFAINVTSRWELTRELTPLLRDGRVLFIGSDAGRNPRIGGAAYSIAQAASEVLRVALGKELESEGIAVAGFKPGLVDTGMIRGFLALSEAKFPARAAYQDYIESGKITGPETIAKFAGFLLLRVDNNRYTGTEWDIRDENHHGEWCEGPLYPNAST